MADISDLLNTIKTAIYGKDMRSAIHDSINNVNNALETHEDTTANGSTEGHIKLSASTSSSNGVSNGYAATPSAVKSAYDRASTAITNAAAVQTNLDAHAETTATGSVSGHIKLSASVSSSYGVSDGYAATPSAVKSAYDRASTAVTNAATAQSTANNVQTSLAAEVTAREAADTDLQEQLDAEALTRESADATLQNLIDTAESNILALREQAHTHDNMDVLDSITEERTAKWDSIENQVTQEQLDEAIAVEASLREAADEETNDSLTAYIAYSGNIINGLLNELQTIYTMIGVVSYDGGLFTQAQDGETLDGGAFDDTDLESFDCGGFEALTVSAALGETVDCGEY